MRTSNQKPYRVLSLRFLLFAGSVYFFLVVAAHAAGIKVPGLFVYIQYPFLCLSGQNNLGLCIRLGGIFYTASRAESLVLSRSILVAGFGAICMLTVINFETDFRTFSEGIDVNRFHVQVLLLLLYWLLLFFAYRREKEISHTSS